MNNGRRIPQWVPWTVALLILTLLALLDRRDEPADAPPAAVETSPD